MTVIELFDKTPLENIITTLALKPDRVIFVTSDYRRASRSIPVYREILDGRGIRTDMAVKSVVKNDIEDIAETLAELLTDTEETYVVDISGGDEGSLVAVGMVLGTSRFVGRDIYAFRINAVSRHGVLFQLTEADGERRIERNIYDFSYNSQVYLTVRENIKLNGGVVFGTGIKFDPENGEESGDIDAMWDICRRDPSGWNSKIGRLSAAVSRMSDGEDIYAIPKDSIGNGRNDADETLWNELVERGLILIENDRSRRGMYVFRYKNKITAECLTKAGSVLEYLTYRAALGVVKDELPLYNSAEVGIVIGWDDDVSGTKNEIDCMLMCGCVPVFISCKNGEVKTDELYKLGTVAEKFGSGYGKTALLSTAYFDENSRSFDGHRAAETLKDRADDMGIRMISKVHMMPEERLKRELSKLTN